MRCTSITGASRTARRCRGLRARARRDVTDLPLRLHDDRRRADAGTSARARVWRAVPSSSFARHSVSCHSNAGDGTSGQQVRCEPALARAFRLADRQGFRALAIGSATEARDERYAAWEGRACLRSADPDVAGLLAAVACGASRSTPGIRHLAAGGRSEPLLRLGAIPLSLIRCVAGARGTAHPRGGKPVSDVDTRILVDGRVTRA
jgi:hypothetical protein